MVTDDTIQYPIADIHSTAEAQRNSLNDVWDQHSWRPLRRAAGM